MRYGLRLAEDNEGYPYKITVDDGGPVEAVWDMTDKFGKPGYKCIFDLAEEYGIDGEDVG